MQNRIKKGLKEKVLDKDNAMFVLVVAQMTLVYWKMRLFGNLK